MTDEFGAHMLEKFGNAKPGATVQQWLREAFDAGRSIERALLSASKPAAPVQSREPFGYAPLPEYEQAIDGQYKRSCVTVSRKPGGAFQIPLYCAPQPCGDAEQADEAVTLPQPVLDALRFYANGHHYNIDDDHQQFDTVSGEPQNWLFSERDDDCTMIEDGSIAKAVLLGGLPGFEEPTEPLEGEVFGVAPGFELSQEFVTRASKDADAPDVIGNVLAASPAAPAQSCSACHDDECYVNGDPNCIHTAPAQPCGEDAAILRRLQNTLQLNHEIGAENAAIYAETLDKFIASAMGEDAANEEQEFRSIEDWERHYLPNGLPERPEFETLSAAHTVDAANGAIGEREAFEADYAKVWNAAMKENGWNADHTADDVKDLREGITYGEGRDYLNARWEGWQARAASPQAMATDADTAAQEAGFADFRSALNWIAGHQCDCCSPVATATQPVEQTRALTELSDEWIEMYAQRHIAPGAAKFRAKFGLDVPYQQTEQFKRMKAYTQDVIRALLAAAQPTSGADRE